MFRILNIFLVLSISIFLIGCNSSGDGDGDDNLTLTLIGEDSATLNAIGGLKSEYEKETGIEIEIVALPFEEAMEKSNQDLRQGNGLYDILLQYNFSLSSYVRNNYVHSLDDLTRNIDASKLEFENDLFQADWEEVGYYYKDFEKPELGIKKVGYPFASNSMLLVYNKDWFDDPKYQKEFQETYGKDLVVPTTWEDLKEIAEFFTIPEKDMYGITMEGANGGWLYYQWVNMLYGIGGKVMDKKRGWEGDENTPIFLNSPQSISTMEMLLSLKPFNKGNFFDVDMYNQKELMKEGNVALAVMWSDVLYDLIDLNNVESTKFGFSTVPGDKSMNAGGAFFVNKHSKHPNEAMKFIAWLMEENNQIEMLKKGLCSPRVSIYDDPSVQHIPYLKALRQSLERGVYMAEAGPDVDVITENITKYAQKVWRGELLPEEAVTQMYSETVSERSKVFTNF